jgi:hypothetical protein
MSSVQNCSRNIRVATVNSVQMKPDISTQAIIGMV